MLKMLASAIRSLLRRSIVEDLGLVVEPDDGQPGGEVQRPMLPLAPSVTCVDHVRGIGRDAGGRSNDTLTSNPEPGGT